MRKKKKGIDAEELIEVRRSKVHGFGAFAKRSLPAGVDIGTYEGRRYTLKQAMRKKWNPTSTYLFEMSDGTIVNGGEGGNATRHLNHACDPNCEAYEDAMPDGTPTIRLKTKTAVAEGEELFLDYQLNLEEQEDLSLYRCHCGAHACRGTLGAEPG